MQNNKNLPTLQDIYSSLPIEQSTDNLTNQTSFVVNFMNAYNLSHEMDVSSFSDIRCKYCKGFYFPQIKKESKKETRINGQKIMRSEEKKSLNCGLCGAVNETNEQIIVSKFCQFSQQQKKENCLFQSLIVSQSQSKAPLNTSIPLIKTNSSPSKNSISFVFYIDIMSLSQSIKSTVITYLKTVISQYFSNFTQSIQSNPQVDFNQQQQNAQKHSDHKQQYNLIILLNINDQLHLSYLNTMSTINIDSLIKQKILSSIPTENTPEMHEKQNQRKISLIQLINGSGVDLRKQVENIEEYLEMIVEEINEDGMGNKHGVNSSAHFSMLNQLLAFDKDVSRSYATVWIGQTPLLNYEPHRVKKSNIHSIIYLFHQLSSHQSNQPLSQSIHQSKLQFQHSNIRNQLILIKDNYQVYFLSSTEQGVQQFYYKLYELFSIVQYPKLFRPRWTIKSDSKYPPLLTNEFPSFFIKPSSVLLFIVSALVSSGNMNSKFQVAVVYEDWNMKEKLWVINWNKDIEKENIQLNQIKHITRHKQNQQTYGFSFIEKLPQIYNYICTLARYALIMCIRSKNDFSSQNLNKSLFTINKVTSHHFCMLFQSIINRGTFKTGTTQVSIPYVQSIYDYCTGVKNIPYEVLRFLANCQSNIKKATEMVYPLLVRNQAEENSSCVLYWGEAYFCLNDHSEDQNSQDQDWYAQFIDTSNQYSGKYYTKRLYYQAQTHSDESELLKFYLKKLDQNQNPTFKQEYLPIYFSVKNQ